MLFKGSNNLVQIYRSFAITGNYWRRNFSKYGISLEMPVPSQGHYGFHSFPVVDWFCLFIYLWVLTFPLLDCSEFGNFVITLIDQWHNFDMDRLGLKVKELRLSRIGLKPIGPIAPNLAQRLMGPLLEWSTLGCSSTHNNNTTGFYREQRWVHHLPRPALMLA